MTRRRAGRKTRQEKLVSLRETLKKKQEQKLKIEEDIKKIQEQIEEIENYFLIQETTRIKKLLEKQGLSLEDLTKAVEEGAIQIKSDQDNEGSSD